MDISDHDKDHYSIFICDRLFISKQNAIANFQEYLEHKRKEFEHEVTRKMFPQLNLPPIEHHKIILDGH